MNKTKWMGRVEKDMDVLAMALEKVAVYRDK